MNPKFHLVRWYHLVVNSKRCLHLTTFPIEDWTCPGNSKVMKDPSEFEFSSGDEVDLGKCPLIRKTGELNDELAEIVLQKLRAGLPYPGDSQFRRANRFAVGTSDKDEFLTILDHERDEALKVHVSKFRNASFDLGLWYAQFCAMRKVEDLPCPESAMKMVARWQRGRLPEETIMGHYFWSDTCPRFFVQRDPTDANLLLVTDRRVEQVYPLRSQEAEGHRFNVCDWFRGVIESFWFERSTRIEMEEAAKEEEVEDPCSRSARLAGRAGGSGHPSTDGHPASPREDFDFALPCTYRHRRAGRLHLVNSRRPAQVETNPDERSVGSAACRPRFEVEDSLFYVINVNSYDLILGTPFLWQHQVMVGFNPARVIVGSKESLPIASGAETKPAVNAIDFEDPEVVKARNAHLFERLTTRSR